MDGLITIAAVDDEPEIRDMLVEYFGRRGLQIKAFADGDAFRADISDTPVDLVLLDVNLGGGEDGLSIARWTKENTQSAVIMLTAAGDVVDRIVGLELGADDYIAKPFDLREVHARIKSVLRRGEATANDSVMDDTRVRIGDCHLDLEAHQLYGPEGEEISITSMEFDLIKAFIERPNRVLSRDQLLNIAHNRDWDPYDRSIDIRIARLRRKIERDPAKPQVIKTVRGAGYVYVPSGG
jgi:DNA-binding response OmpR family regulator